MTVWREKVPSPLTVFAVVAMAMAMLLVWAAR